MVSRWTCERRLIFRNTGRDNATRKGRAGVTWRAGSMRSTSSVDVSVKLDVAACLKWLVVLIALFS